jgi:hypothetical protein
MSGLLLKPHKGSGVVEGLLSKEGAHFLGWDRNVGNEGLQIVSLSWHMCLSSYVVRETLAWLEILYPGVVLSPTWG